MPNDRHQKKSAMETSNIHSPSKPAARRPALFGGDPASEEGRPHSMLAPLERAPRRLRASPSHGRPGGRRLAAAFGAAICAGLAALLLTGHPRSERAAATGSASAVAALSAPPVEKNPEDAAPAFAPEPATNARIEPASDRQRATTASPASAVAQAIPLPPAAPAGPVAGGASASGVPGAQATASPDPSRPRSAGGALPNAAPASAAGRPASPGSRSPASAARPHAPQGPRTDISAKAPHAPAPAEASKARATKAKGDPDIDLVAAIIARLDRRGSEPAAPARSPSAPGGAAPSDVAARLRQCGVGRDPAEAHRCRSRACDGQRGRIDACPASQQPSKTSRHGGARDADRT
jgi:hypothetical protein